MIREEVKGIDPRAQISSSEIRCRFPTMVENHRRLVPLGELGVLVEVLEGLDDFDFPLLFPMEAEPQQQGRNIWILWKVWGLAFEFEGSVTLGNFFLKK